MRIEGKWGAGVEGGHGAVADVVGGAGSRDGEEKSPGGIEIDEGRGAFVVGGETDLDGFATVVLSAEERGAATIADAIVYGRLIVDVEDGFAFAAGSPAAEARNDFVVGKFVIDDSVERKIFAAKKFIERFGLGQRAGEAVEEEAALAAETTGTFANHFPDGGVGDESATAHEVERGSHGRRRRAIAARRGRAENVAGGEMAGAEALVEKLGLGAFADAGSAEED